MKFFLFYIALFLCLFGKAQTYKIVGSIGSENKALAGVEVMLSETGQFTQSNSQGQFEFDSLKVGSYTLRFFYEGYHSKIKKIELAEKDLSLLVEMKKFSKELAEVSIEEQKDNEFRKICHLCR